MNNMQKIIRIVLPWACFALIIWVCRFRGSDYIDWRWLIGAVGIRAHPINHGDNSLVL